MGGLKWMREKGFISEEEYENSMKRMMEKKETQTFRRPSSWKQHWRTSGSSVACTCTQAKIRQSRRSMGPGECLAEGTGMHYNT